MLFYKILIINSNFLYAKHIFIKIQAISELCNGHL